MFSWSHKIITKECAGSGVIKKWMPQSCSPSRSSFCFQQCLSSAGSFIEDHLMVCLNLPKEFMVRLETTLMQTYQIFYLRQLWSCAVFDSCFSTEVLPDGLYNIYLHEIVIELHEEFPDSSFLAFNFREGEKRSQFAEILWQHDITIIDYPRQYEGCLLLPLSHLQHFLRVCENWLSLGNNQNIILLHCDRGGWPLLAFLLSCLLTFRKMHSGEQKTLEIVHREAPKGLLQLLSPLNPLPSQLRYLQYVARRNITPQWPPAERSLSLDCLILRSIPSFDSDNGCRPLIRVFGQNIHKDDGISGNMLFSMAKKKSLRHYRQVSLLFPYLLQDPLVHYTKR